MRSRKFGKDLVKLRSYTCAKKRQGVLLPTASSCKNIRKTDKTLIKLRRCTRTKVTYQWPRETFTRLHLTAFTFKFYRSISSLLKLKHGFSQAGILNVMIKIHITLFNMDITKTGNRNVDKEKWE